MNLEQAREVEQTLRGMRWEPDAEEAADTIAALIAEVERLQKVLDSRPAINAGLPATYIKWSQSIYAMELGEHEAKQ